MTESMKMRWTGHKRQEIHNVGKPEGSHSHKWEDNLKLDLEETGCDFVDWICLCQARVQ